MVKEVKEGDRFDLQKHEAGLTSFFHRHTRNLSNSYFFLSFTHTHTHTLRARVRVRPRVSGGERKKEVNRYFLANPLRRRPREQPPFTAKFVLRVRNPNGDVHVTD